MSQSCLHKGRDRPVEVNKQTRGLGLYFWFMSSGPSAVSTKTMRHCRRIFVLGAKAEVTQTTITFMQLT